MQKVRNISIHILLIVALVGTFSLTPEFQRILDSFTTATVESGATYYPDPNEADQGAVGSGKTIKSFVDLIGTSRKATLVLRHRGITNQTYYYIDTDETIPSNITLEVQPGAIIADAGNETLTINGPFKAGLSQCFGWDGTGIIKFGLGSIHALRPEWVGAKADNSTDNATALLKILNIAAQYYTDNAISMPIRYGPGIYKTSSGLPISKRMTWIGDGLRGTRIKCTATTASLYTATYASNTFTDNLDATIPTDISDGSKEVDRVVIENIEIDSNGTITGNAPSGAAWSAAIQFVGMTSSRLTGLRIDNFKTDDYNGYSFIACWSTKVNDALIARGSSYSGGSGIKIGDQNNSMTLYTPTVTGSFDVGIEMSTAPSDCHSVTIVEPDVENIDNDSDNAIGIQLTGRSSRIYGGFVENCNYDIAFGSSTKQLIFGFADYVKHGTNADSQYAYALVNVEGGRIVFPALPTDYQVKEFSSAADDLGVSSNNRGVVIELLDTANPSNAVGFDILAYGLDNGKNIVRVYGADYSKDGRQYMEYTTNSSKTTLKRGPVWSSNSDLSITPESTSDDIVAEGNGAGLSILTPNNTNGKINFGDPEDADVGQILYDHSDNRMDFFANDGRKLRLIDDGVGINVSATSFGTNADGVLAIGSGTAPTSSPTDMVQLWVEDVGGAGQAELRVRDELGNTSTLSPHNFEMFEPDESYELPWSYYSENGYIGKKINVDMYGAIKAIEQLTGEQFIYIEDIERQSWDENQENIRMRTENRIRELNQRISDIDNVIAETNNEKVKNRLVAIKKDLQAEIPKPYKKKSMPEWIRQRIRD